MNEIKSLFDAGTVAENAVMSFGRALSALTVTLEGMDDDGLQPRGKESIALAINFAARFPMYRDTLYMILQNMQMALDDLKAGADSIYRADKRQRETQGPLAP